MYNDQFKVGDIVKLPFKEYAIIEEILVIPWGYPYICRIILGTLSDIGSRADFSADQIELAKPNDQKLKQIISQARCIVKYVDKHTTKYEPIEVFNYDDHIHDEKFDKTW